MQHLVSNFHPFGIFVFPSTLMTYWNMKLDGILKKMKFQRCVEEQAIYRRSIGVDLIIVGVYVDDLVITESSTPLISKFKQDMAVNFDMTNLGLLR